MFHPWGILVAPEAAVGPRRKNTKLRYVVRQPVFDRDQPVLGYELRFRDGVENAFSGLAPDAGLQLVMSSCAKAWYFPPCTVPPGRVPLHCSHFGLVPAQAFRAPGQFRSGATDPINGKPISAD